jgi:PhoPQ-activated pathogenicity-related protein
VVSGASKRGWTTWLTAAADKRVVAVAPMVIDLLNVDPSFRHHHAAYGRYADAVKPYVENNIVQRMDQPAMKASLAILDPYAYRDRLTMPKLLVNSTGDQFFLPDSWRFYWNDLGGPKQLRYIPNTDHGLDGTAAESLRSFFITVLAGKSLPAFTWSEEAPGRLRVETKDAPTRVLAWSATNAAGRDFMLRTIGKTWQSRELEAVKPGVYLGEIPEPAKGWSAVVVELVFPDASGSTTGIRLTTGVSVTPARLPFSERPDDAGKR